MTGRLVENGMPQAQVQMTCDRPYEGGESRFEHGSVPSGIKIGKDGRFRVSGLVPGLKHSLRLWRGRMFAGEPIHGVIVKPGENKNLGDVKVGD